MRPKALCSIGWGPHAELLAVSKPTFEAYGLRHGYELVFPAQRQFDRPVSWAKVSLLRELLERYELVVWLDADAVVIDGTLDIAEALGPDRDLGLVAHRRGAELVPNLGVIVLRSGEFARELLDWMWSATHLIDHPWWENAALCEALGYALPGSLAPGLRGGFYRRVRRVSGRELRPFRRVRDSRYMGRTQFLSNEWNSIHGDRAEHPRIVHFLASPLADRLVSMEAAAAAAVL